MTVLEKGQVYRTVEGITVNILGRRHNDDIYIRNTGATAIISSDQGYYYQDGPLVGKWQTGSRTLEDPGYHSYDLVIPVTHGQLQLRLFD